jgi:hypothetical protein
MKKHHRISFTVHVDVLHEESLLPDDEWRKDFYSDVKDHKSLAEHLAYSLGFHSSELRLSKLDGFADREDWEASAYVYDYGNTEIEELPDEE